jgi:Leucine rich repeat
MNALARKRWISSIGAMVLGAILASCIGDSGIAQGGGTETGNGTVQGLAAYANGSPVLNAQIRIRTEGFTSFAESPTGQLKWDARTDANGRFHIQGLKAGNFIAEFRDDQGQAAIAAFQLESDSAHALVVGDLHPVAAVTGRLLSPGGLSAPGRVAVYGLDHWTETDSTGRFSLQGMPEGRFTLYFEPKLAKSGDMDLPKVVLAAGEAKSLGDFELPPRSCQDLACDTLQVRALMAATSLSSKSWGDLAVTGLDAKGKLRVIELHLAKMGLTSLPDAIGQLSALRKLDLSDNSLAQLPASLSHLRALRSLNAYHNQLVNLPNQIGQMTGLTAINVRNNRLTALPISLGHLFGLELFDAQDNALTDLPASVLNLGPLALALEGNPLCNLSPELMVWVKQNDPAFAIQPLKCP